jgi:putative hydrolase of the HAD superfamily
MPRAVLFDVDGVLIHGFHVREEKRRRWDTHMAADLGIEPAMFYEHFVKDVLPDVLTGRKSLVRALEEALPLMGYRGSPMTVIAYWLRRDTQLNLQLVDLLKVLRAKGNVRLYMATNQEDLRALYLWDTLGLHHLFDDIFHAARLGATKPDRRFFEGVAERIGPQQQPPLMFDDMPEVATAAKAFGWEGVHADDFADIRNHPWIVEHLGRADPGIRAFRPGDGEALVDAHRMAILDTSEEFYTREELESWSAGLSSAFYAPPEGGVTEVAVSASGKPVAFCQSVGNEVLGLYVHPEWQRNGIGQKLMRLAEGRAASIGSEIVRVHASISAIPFYERIGYRVVESSHHQTRGGRLLRSAKLEKTIVTTR